MNITEDIIKALIKDQYGWISPSGQILTCKLHQHLEVLANNGFQSEWFNTRILPMREAVSVAREEHSETGEGWHAYAYDG